MVGQVHNSDYLTLPNEDEVRAAIRKTNPAPGSICSQHLGNMSQLKTPERSREIAEVRPRASELPRCGSWRSKAEPHSPGLQW